MHAILLSLCIPAGGLNLATDPPPASPAAQNEALDVSRYVEVHAHLQNLLLFRNDADFDTTDPYYDEDGQTVGAVATIFTPAITFHVLENLRLYYEVELGLNYWSKNNPDQQAAFGEDVFVLKHREIYGEGELPVDFWGFQKLGFRVGYSYFRDPTGLFIAHWMGVARVAAAWSPNGRVEIFAGQVPDQTYEGINVLENNFTRDILVFGAATELKLGDGWELKVGLHNLYDTHLEDQTRWLLTPNAHAGFEHGIFSGFVDAALQVGAFEGEAIGGEIQTVVAWAAQGRAALDLGDTKLSWNVLVLSPDDAHSANGMQHAFLYSGKSKSATRLLTEDELRDWYDNLDERMSTFQGGFFTNRAGLFVSDLEVRHTLSEVFELGAVVGAGTVLKAENALGHNFVGVEGDLIFTARLGEHLRLDLVAAGLIPGPAGAAKINEINRSRTEPLGMVEASLVVAY